MSDEEGAAFESELFFEQAVALRRIDDDAKVSGLAGPRLEHYRETAMVLAVDLGVRAGS